MLQIAQSREDSFEKPLTEFKYYKQTSFFDQNIVKQNVFIHLTVNVTRTWKNRLYSRETTTKQLKKVYFPKNQQFFRKTA